MSTRNPEKVTQKLEADLEACLGRLCQQLTVCASATNTHQLLTITGIDRSPECLQDLAIYCVGQIAKAIQINLDIRADLLGEGEGGRVQLVSDVQSVIGGNNNDMSDEQKQKLRDPWLFEALSHLFVHLSTYKPDFFPLGKVIGLTVTHGKVTEQGLDLVALYSETSVGLGVGESKAYENNPSGGLRDAAEKFKEVDQGNYDSELRAIVGQMRYAISIEYQQEITGAFWKNERAYYPFVGYDSIHNPRWTTDRAALSTLDVPITHRILVPFPINSFRQFFDDLADRMRTYLDSLESDNNV